VCEELIVHFPVTAVSILTMSRQSLAYMPNGVTTTIQFERRAWWFTDGRDI
jgi:hypothetical protein